MNALRASSAKDILAICRPRGSVPSRSGTLKTLAGKHCQTLIQVTGCYPTTVPNNLPIPEVRAIASAPGYHADCPRRTLHLLLLHRSRREMRERPTTRRTRWVQRARGRHDDHEQGHRRTSENETADVSAASTGRAVVIFEIPELIVCMSAQGIFCHQLLGGFPRKSSIDTTFDRRFRLARRARIRDSR